MEWCSFYLKLAKQTSWPVFNVFVQVVNELRSLDPMVTCVIGQLDCYHSLDLLIRLRHAGEMLVKVLKCIYSC